MEHATRRVLPCRGVHHRRPLQRDRLTRPDWDKRLNEARAALDPNTRQEMFNQLQEELWNEGGYIMWGFNNWVDAVAANVRGIEPSDVLALDGHNTRAWFA